MSLQLLSLQEVKQSINMKQAIDATEKAFIQLAHQQVQLPLRTPVPITKENGLTLTMPAYLESDEALGLKVVSIFPNNFKKNRPSITGFIMLLDATTGEPKMLMDAGYLTALRTGAVSGLATQYFARDDSEHVAIIGSGVQAYTQLEAVAAVRAIKRVSVWSRDIKNAAEFANHLARHYEVKAYANIADAVKEADIICTATSSTEPLVHLHSLKPHAHINAIGSHSRAMQEIAQDVLTHSTVIVDQREAALAESGEIMRAVEQHAIDASNLIELGQWLLHKTPCYKQQLTTFKSVGLAIQDLAVAEEVYRNAMKNKLGTPFALS